MRLELLDFLVCPLCESALELTQDDTDRQHVMSGSLWCAECSETYPIIRGVPRMNREMERLERTAQTFTYEWKAHHAGKLESNTLFGLTLEQDWRYFLEATGLEDRDLEGMLILDAGCGSARPTRQMAEHGARAVVGVDIIDAVEDAFAATRDIPNVHIVQGNIFELPIRKHTFDLVWSNGVIHHTPDAAAAHAALAKVVKPGGILYVWVYARRFNPFRFTKDVLDFLRVTRLPERVLLRIARAFCTSRCLSWRPIARCAVCLPSSRVQRGANGRSGPVRRLNSSSPGSTRCRPNSTPAIRRPR